MSPCFRAEPNISTRHLSEFYMIEAEVAFVNELEELLVLIEKMIKFSIRFVLYDSASEFKAHQNDQPDLGVS